MIAHRQRRTDRVFTEILATAALIVVAVLLPFGRANAQDLSGPAQQLLGALNAQRAAAGLGPFVADPLLNQAAQAHADDILHNYNYSHRGSDGSFVHQRVARTGYSSSPWVSENWVSSTSADGAMTWWLNDYVHRGNIFTPRWTEVGVGVSVRESGEMVFVTVFSAGRDASAAVAVAASAGAVVQSIAVPAGGTDYVIQPGDTLLDISYRYELDWTEIARANSITDDTLLQIGQVLRIPDADGQYTVGASNSSGGTGGPAEIAGVPYEIRSGETLVSIAAKHGTTWEELAGMNGLGEYSILQIGQTIRVPAPDETVAPVDLDRYEAAAQQEAAFAEEEAAEEGVAVQEDVVVEAAAEDSPVLHLVQTGDTVFGIALAYSVDWQELLVMNDLSEASILQPGQPIRLR